LLRTLDEIAADQLRRPDSIWPQALFLFVTPT
jgi:hypothetical protein